MRVTAWTAALAAAALFLPFVAQAQDEASFDAETGQDALAGVPAHPEEPEAAPETGGLEGLVRAAKKRAAFSVANIFTSRDVWRGIDWFGNNDPAYLLGGDMKFDLTPYDAQHKRDIWEVKLHTMVAGAYSLKSGHENVDRWKVMAVLENRFYRYLDLDIGYKHYGLPPFDDHDRDFEELMLRAGFNSVPTFTPLSLPGFKEPVTAIPFAVHYGAYSAYSSKRFTLTNYKFGFHGYPNSWWWHNVEFNLIVPFPDAVPEKTCGVLRCLKLDSHIWAIDRENVLPGLKDGLQDAEFGLALPLILDLGGGLGLDRCLWGVLGESKIIAEPFIRYALDAQNLDSKTGAWTSEDEIFGGVALVYAF